MELKACINCAIWTKPKDKSACSYSIEAKKLSFRTNAKGTLYCDDFELTSNLVISVSDFKR